MRGMSEAVRYKFITTLCEYLKKYMREVSNRDLGLFEATTRYNEK